MLHMGETVPRAGGSEVTACTFSAASDLPNLTADSDAPYLELAPQPSLGYLSTRVG